MTIIFGSNKSPTGILKVTNVSRMYITLALKDNVRKYIDLDRLPFRFLTPSSNINEMFDDGEKWMTVYIVEFIDDDKSLVLPTEDYLINRITE